METKLARPYFLTPEKDFLKVLNERADAYFREKNISSKAPLSLKIKAIFLYAAFVFLYSSFFLFPQNIVSTLLLATLLGFTVCLIGMNVLHDCAHGTYFKNPFFAKIGYHTWDFFGVSSDLYRVKHMQVHHYFTNITGWDGDMDEAYPMLRLNPFLKALPGHRYQHFYALPLYSLLTLSWVLFADVVRLFDLKVCNFEMKPLGTFKFLKTIFFKIMHLLVFVAIPSFYFPFLSVLSVFLYVHLMMGCFLCLVFQVAHINEKSEFRKDNSGNMNSDWVTHQIKTSMNFANQSPFWTSILGGLNFQIEHHLFPKVCHVYYPQMSQIVRQFCKEQNLPYHEYPTFGSAIRSHFRFLKKLGQTEC